MGRIWLDEEPDAVRDIRIKVTATVLFDGPTEEPNLQKDTARCSKLVQATLRKAGLTLESIEAYAVEDVELEKP